MESQIVQNPRSKIGFTFNKFPIMVKRDFNLKSLLALIGNLLTVKPILHHLALHKREPETLIWPQRCLPNSLLQEAECPSGKSAGLVILRPLVQVPRWLSHTCK